MKWVSSKVFDRKIQAERGAEYWRERGYNVRIQKVKGGYKYYYRKK